jgi:LPXTG-site transpeptidase (sortase) family protein
MKGLGVLLVALGLLISVAAAASAIADAQPTASLVDQGSSQEQSGMGFEPMIVPGTLVAEPEPAPTLLPQTSVLNGDLQSTPPARVIPTTPTEKWQELAGGESLPPTATDVRLWIPDRIVIPAIKLDAPVQLATFINIDLLGKPYQEWVPPNSFAVGRLTTSPSLGIAGNTVFIGHHNVFGKVFRYLVDLQVGDLILVYSGKKEFAYVITQRMILRERDQPLDVRLKNAQWIAPSLNERLTLVTCWPYTSNTHRLIIVAVPGSRDVIEKSRLSPRPTSRSINP